MSEQLRAELNRLHEGPCHCATCTECRGTGNVWFSFGGRQYLGSSRRDDLGEMESCEYCGGKGILQLCARCSEIEEIEQLLEDEEYAR